MIGADLRGFTIDLLGFLEEREIRLLGWGFYDAAFDAGEVEALIEEEAPEALLAAWNGLRDDGHNLAGLLPDMEHEGLLYGCPDGGFRTRFAEGVRLIARLRQMFRASDWAEAKRLVADIKIHLGPRRYPSRDRSVAECWAHFSSVVSSPLQQVVFERLATGADGEPLCFSGFQMRAFAHILGRYGQPGRSGSIISAGTGSGKTKAFYIPAFLGIAADLTHDTRPFTKVLAVYPRNVLLADQLREALAEAGKIGPLLKSRHLRPVTFGALLGDTPPERAFETPNSVYLKNWRREKMGWVVPFLRSPSDGKSELIWRDADRRQNRTCLYRLGRTDAEPNVPDGVLALTREILQRRPPDFLFLSLEMLSRELGNPLWARAFGIDVGEKAPRLVLFDEVHTYAGLSGAQVSWIVRRWRFAARPKALHMVGLSATLADAKSHLATVAGVRADNVAEFSPLEDELVSEGMEYNLAIKGDPSSGASLLATTLQTSMLASRLLTPLHAPTPTPDRLRSTDLYARKLFGFTDNLDSVNRWYADLVDAERNRRLAGLRLPPDKAGRPVPRTEEAAMDAEGQIWRLPDSLGHDLTQAARVSRCSSQDPGANANSDIIVATSSLEVGFDDPEVGIMLHHKAPRSMASFLQRKGRAGRRRGTRPMTLVVLSDYGNDRWFFQNSERLFDPTIERIRLPVTNPYVLRVQATAFLIDWLGRKVKQGDPFSYLRRPDAYRRSAQEHAAEVLRDMIALGANYQEFRQQLRELVHHALLLERRGDATDAAVDAILWDAPRPVLRQAVPALLRKLEENWGIADPAQADMQEDQGCRQPLPTYLPSSSFADLDSSEIPVTFPYNTVKEATSAALGRALAESCPGRVSKRYSVKETERGYWLVSSSMLLDPPAGPLAVEALFPGSVPVRTVDGIQICQPAAIPLTERPEAVKDSSNATWSWRSWLEFQGTGLPLPALLGSSWAEAVQDVAVFLHRDQSSLRVLRFASSFRFSLMLAKGTERRGRVHFASVDEAGQRTDQAVGFEQTVDALRIRLRPGPLGIAPSLDTDILARLRQDYFLDLMLASDLLADAANSFALRWVWQTSLAMLTATALKNEVSLSQAQQLLQKKRPQAAAAVLQRIFGSGQGEEAEEQEGGLLLDRVLGVWNTPALSAEVERLESVLWEPEDEEFLTWLRQRYALTLAEAVQQACGALVEDVTEGDLIADVVLGEGALEIVVSETSPGGVGQLEAVSAAIAHHPDRFEEAVLHALEHCERQQTDTTLFVALNAARSPGPLAAAFQAVRGARGFGATAAAKAELAAALQALGLDDTRSTMVSVVGRLLRPGSEPANDRWALLLNRGWRRLSRRVGAPLEPRVLAYLVAQTAASRRRTARILQAITGHPPSDAQIVATVQDALLTGCEDSCPHCLPSSNRYAQAPQPSRALALCWLGASVPVVDAGSGSSGWIEQALAALTVHAKVDIAADRTTVPAVARGLQLLLTQEVERDYIWSPVSVAGVRRNGTRLLVRLRLHGEVNV